MIELTQESYTKAEVQGLLQSETDKVRTDYSRRLKAVEQERDALKPAEKTQAELDLEKRTAELSRRERALACREAGIDPAFADLLRDDADLSKLPELFKADTGYRPSGHKSNGNSMTKEEFAALPYSKQAQLFQENPDLYKTMI